MLDRIRELEEEVERVQRNQGSSAGIASIAPSEAGGAEGGGVVGEFDQIAGLPRPDIALVSTHGASFAETVDPPKELTDYL